ncbi:DUF1998 domain-containing protein [Methanolacinia paynteri]|uniref:DUF1998 domain-containing protein n=1 Tax=Methanolacinia paynteri TaxID=230356 RepID=UPI00064F4C84|nr:DUF1998 domain-containing protein [Methanolacinia paynteri]
MVNNDLGKLRRSMVVMTHAPGAIVDFRADGAPVSGVVAGLEEWDRNFPPYGLTNPQKISEPRLEKRLGVGGFRLPPVVDEGYRDESGRPDGRRLVAVRFPKWLQCPECERIAPFWKWNNDPGRAYRYCPNCSSGRKKVFVIPVRFIMACESGHIQDFPWHRWVGHKDSCSWNKNHHRGFLKLHYERPGLAGLYVSCPECGASRSMDGIFNPDTMMGVTNCYGKRPWLSGPDQNCTKQPITLQRGASNLYFPVLESALSIPPWTDRLQSALGIYWSSIVGTEDPSERALYIRILARKDLKQVLGEFHMTPEELADQIEERLSRYSEDTDPDIRQEEYRQLTSGTNTSREDDREFEMRNINIPNSLSSYFSHIVRVVRLREVRALRGFTRINPPGGSDDQVISPIFSEDLHWLPAIEVRGEGIFLEFEKKALLKWEKNRDNIERADKVNNPWLQEWRKRYGAESNPPAKITPRYLLVHTFAHALMRQLTLDCGYSSASLRERLYISEGKTGMAGVLIYTATSDSDGTLGGLQRQGTPGRIEDAVRSAIQSMEWCSSDPLCIHNQELSDASENHFNLAACHACCLAPETSCETYNRFLDRATLIGIPEKLGTGYFTQLLKR